MGALGDKARSFQRSHETNRRQTMRTLLVAVMVTAVGDGISPPLLGHLRLGLTTFGAQDVGARDLGQLADDLQPLHLLGDFVNLQHHEVIVGRHCGNLQATLVQHIADLLGLGVWVL